MCKETAQDLAQEVFTKVYYRLHKFDLGSNFSAWLFRIAHNACMDERAYTLA
ncbi:sigma factor [Brevibacillus laterosporus]|uniref:sigma factor n=1 Tax=Brevibacillus laterosporus TaxID=1465 RepID=UPI00264ECA0A|nr:sigma factor [Brevibacillus laterosporus]MDN9010318.1 sigma factor [Brevibacillus laterosporus]MDO0941205.1 sigma factor [Brevibacillus laterosporus]